MSYLSILEGAEGAEGAASMSFFPGYRSGLQTPASTLAPGVDPATAASLVRVREALHHSRSEITWDPPRKSAQLPALDDPERLASWSIDIRAQSFMTELLGPLQLSADAARESFTVVHVQRGAKAPIPLVEIVRPRLSLFESQVPMVLDATALREERLQELITQIGIPVQYWASIMDLNPTTTPFTLELMALAYTFGSAITQPCKHTLGCPRPERYSPSVQPVINPRRFGAFPSGHAMEAFMTARLLQLVSNQKAPQLPGGKDTEPRLEQQLQRLAMRIADNRIVAGVHFPIDSTAGRMLGETLATYIAYRGGHAASESWIARKFNGKPKDDKNSVITKWEHPFDRHDALDEKTKRAPFFQDNDGEPRGKGLPPWTVVSSGKSFLHWLWNKAQAEWT